MEELEKKWNNLIILLQDNFDEELNLKSILFFSILCLVFSHPTKSTKTNIRPITKA